MVKMYLPVSLLLASAVRIVDGATKQFTPIEAVFNAFVPQKPTNNERNYTKILDPFAPTAEEREEEARARRQRQRERNERVKEIFKNVKPKDVERVSEEELESMDSEYLRKLAWGGSKSGGELSYFIDPGEDYDMWSQAYRMLGGFIDCDHDKSDDDGGGGSHEEGGEGGRCSRWMMWAAYVDPNYQGNGYDEYFGDEPVGTLDCHRPDTQWQLMGVYRQEFYQYIEQISKHLWAIDEYEYVVALAGLAYMTDATCFYVGDSNNGEAIYAGVAPKEYGRFEMALYTDDYCLFPNDDLGMTYDDFGLTNDISLGGSGDGGGDDENWAQEWWQDTEEYTLTQLNDVYDTFRYCTSCIDYPTYQDGYVIGDNGMDDDDLINQCWKFYSHDSFTCESDCIAKGHAQGTILSIDVGGKFYGQVIQEFWDEANLQMGENSQQVETQLSRLLANVFVTFSFVVFVATFLAFAVARRSRYRESRSSKARRLLGNSRKRSSSRKRRSKSRDRGSDGIMRSKSGSRRKSRSRSKNRDRDYEPPRSED
mmetsp:Transcript_23450/g.57658  ORF Transcript_23450/g.57658 Transcript_23450/m.57658 type:complete len:537 (-) Transcript_23450:118-1728(-)